MGRPLCSLSADCRSAAGRPAPTRRQRHPAQRGTAYRCAAAPVESTVYSLGEALFDCLADQRGRPREKVDSWTPYPGGAPANVACAVQKLGVHSGFITALGQDELAVKMLDLLKETGVDVDDVQRNDKPTRDVLVVFDDQNDRQFVGFGSAANDQFADCFIDAAALPLEKLKKAGALVTGTLGLAYPATGAAMEAALAAVKEGPCPVLVDVNWRPVFWEGVPDAPARIREYVDRADIIKLSEEEADFVYGVHCDAALFHPHQVLELVAPTVRGVLVTAGGRGCGYAFRGMAGGEVHSGYVPVLKVDVKDTTGAGDAFLAGFLYGLVKAGGLDALRSDPKKLRKAIQFAAATGGYTTTQNGGIAAQPTLEQAEKLLATADFAKSEE